MSEIRPVFVVLSAAVASDVIYYVAAALLVGLVLLGIAQMSKVATAKRGNALGALSMLVMIVLTMWYFDILSAAELWLAMLAGSAVGLVLMRTVKMIQMPQMVGLLNGFGGAASMLAGLITLFQPAASSVFSWVTAGLAVAVGSLTFSGSVVAAGKLHGLIPGRSLRVKGHSVLVAVSLILSVLLIVLTVAVPVSRIVLYPLVIALALVSGAFGVLFSMRVGGADMPVTISLLNAFSGVAGAIAGMAVNDPLLVAVGGVVGASGLLLTRIMCKAMNRSLLDILLGFSAAPAASKPAAVVNAVARGDERPAADAASNAETIAETDALNDTASRLRAASRVVLIPGYGMALAQAQHQVKRLYDALAKNGADVVFGIHPVAGRMPGHMNVLLAEADVPYDVMCDLDETNVRLAEADVALVIGANDVVNPAAESAEGTPIYGMPILAVDKAAQIVFCNMDAKPGYAGVDNPLYRDGTGRVTCLFGDAADTMAALLGEWALTEEKSEPDASFAADPYDAAAAELIQARTVVIVPGYGMALAQAQHHVKRLYDELRGRGVHVVFGIHPVAGRMPGHMNVLLAEADLPYDVMLEMDEVERTLAAADAMIVIGANDVVNPAAQTAEGTPIYGMPIIDAAGAKRIMFFNFDDKPGYAGVDNPLYRDSSGKVRLLFGDAAETLERLLGALLKANEPAGQDTGAPPAEMTAADTALARLRNAANAVIIPGYGMALAQAQHLVKQLYALLSARGCKVTFGIHPVAGRMPGHMNVLLAEADVPYDLMLEMEAVNSRMASADVAVVVGANDVVNPAAQTAADTPIYGMPILEANRAGHVIFFNMDDKPGYAGVDNPLYRESPDKVSLLFGDAALTLAAMLDALREGG